MNTKKYCSVKNDIPAGEHFAIIEFDTIYTPGDQRSIDYPGHGYPASTDNVSRYISFSNQEEWEKDISDRMTSQYSRKDFVAIRAKTAEIITQHIIKVN